jgi:DNA topoisomerase IB
MREVAEYLGNTPAVVRSSYVDPRVLDLFSDGTTIAAALGDLDGAPDLDDLGARDTVERAVLKMLETGEEPRLVEHGRPAEPDSGR